MTSSMQGPFHEELCNGVVRSLEICQWLREESHARNTPSVSVISIGRRCCTIEEVQDSGSAYAKGREGEATLGSELGESSPPDMSMFGTLNWSEKSFRCRKKCREASE